MKTKLIELNFKIKVINYLNSKNINYSWLELLKIYDDFEDNPINNEENEIDSIFRTDYDTKENKIINNFIHTELIIMRSFTTMKTKDFINLKINLINFFSLLIKCKPFLNMIENSLTLLILNRNLHEEIMFSLVNNDLQYLNSMNIDKEKKLFDFIVEFYDTHYNESKELFYMLIIRNDLLTSNSVKLLLSNCIKRVKNNNTYTELDLHYLFNLRDKYSEE